MHAIDINTSKGVEARSIPAKVLASDLSSTFSHTVSGLSRPASFYLSYFPRQVGERHPVDLLTFEGRNISLLQVASMGFFGYRHFRCGSRQRRLLPPCVVLCAPEVCHRQRSCPKPFELLTLVSLKSNNRVSTQSTQIQKKRPENSPFAHTTRARATTTTRRCA